MLPSSYLIEQTIRGCDARRLVEEITTSAVPYIYLPVPSFWRKALQTLLGSAEPRGANPYLEYLEPEDADHCTLLHIPSDDVRDALRCVNETEGLFQSIVTATPRFPVRMQGWAYFDGVRTRHSGAAATALVVLLDSYDLTRLHERLRDALASLGWQADLQSHSFVPHVTVAYLSPGQRAPETALPQLGSWTADTVCMSWDCIYTAELAR